MINKQNLTCLTTTYFVSGNKSYNQANRQRWSEQKVLRKLLHLTFDRLQ